MDPYVDDDESEEPHESKAEEASEIDDAGPETRVEAERDLVGEMNTLLSEMHGLFGERAKDALEEHAREEKEYVEQARAQVGNPSAGTNVRGRNADIVNMTREEIVHGDDCNLKFYMAATTLPYANVPKKDREEVSSDTSFLFMMGFFESEYNIPVENRRRAVIDDICRSYYHEGFNQPVRFEAYRNSADDVLVVADAVVFRFDAERALLLHTVFKLVDKWDDGDALPQERVGFFVNFYLRSEKLSFAAAEFLSRDLAGKEEKRRDAKKETPKNS